jgi:phage head maturation protease
MSDEIQRAEVPPSQSLMRMAPFALRDTEGEEEGDGLTLDGYGAVFNRETLIDSWEGRFKEKLAPGSMRKSFRELTPRVQFDHGRHPLIGSIPIAALERGYPREEVDPDLAPEGGAHVVARLHDNWLVQPVREAIASGTIDGMSFRFGVNREEWHDHTGRKISSVEELHDLLRRSWLEEVPDEELLVRTLKEVRVSELGPVVWPAYADTSVGVRSQTLTIDLGRLDEAAERNKLARAVLMADRVEATAQPDTSAEADAAEHPDDLDDTQRSTSADADAAEHLSNTTRLDVRHALADINDVWATINDTKGRYSR